LARDPAAFLGELYRVVWQRSKVGVPMAERSAHNDASYGTPRDLEVSTTPIERVLLIGSCLAEAWLPYIPVPVDFVATNHLHALPDLPPKPLDAYDFQIVQIPLRSVVQDDLWWHLPWNDRGGWEAAFETALTRLRFMLSLRCSWHNRSQLLMLVTNFPVPQRNPLGRLLPRFDLRNPVYFIERLNEALAREVESYPNAYILDANEVATLFGKKFIQDDSVNMTNHGALLSSSPFAEADFDRFEPIGPVSDYYDARADLFAQALWLEVVAIYRTVKRLDNVKLIIVDLDDTLWRGVAADNSVGFETAEGWPFGIVEALLYLKQRGVLLAIVSKNDEARIGSLWDEIFLGRLRLDDFAIRRINWQSKSENVAEILSILGLLPESTVFIDDNPRERAEVRSAFPAIRVLGANPYYIRRILLWAPETQVQEVTAESVERTSMVQAQVRREVQRTAMNPVEFLKSLAICLRLTIISGIAHASFRRAFELINKTNQFNTTGQRWSHEEMRAAFARGVRLFSFEAEDVYTKYGLICVVIVDGDMLTQVVMSCRVLGLGVECTAIAEVVRQMGRAGITEVYALLEPTQTNSPTHDLYARCGFASDGTTWTCATAAPPVPPDYVTLVVADR